ncbi:MAG: hypothetical protein M1331_01640 [Candidatus Marsarchaeota archaeon]|nr:hypothetical protein [Candidatus Marsarchaeota archaeon]
MNAKNQKEKQKEERKIFEKTKKESQKPMAIVIGDFQFSSCCTEEIKSALRKLQESPASNQKEQKKTENRQAKYLKNKK